MPRKTTNNPKNKDQSEAPKNKVRSNEKAAAKVNSKDQDSRPYEERTRGQLYEIARELEIEGRSKMDKDQLIRAIRKLQ